MSNLSRTNRLSLVFLIAGLVCCTGFRVWLLLTFGDLSLLDTHFKDLSDALLTGLRFDVKLLSILIIPAYLLTALQAIPGIGKLFSFFPKLLTIYYTFSFLLLILLGFINHYYFSYFQSAIDARIYAVFDDDTSAIFQSVHTDYPIWIAIPFCFMLTAFLYWLLEKSCRPTPIQKDSATSVYIGKTIFLIIILFGLIVGARGSISTFPLGQKNLSVSSEPFINELIPNAAIALHYASLDYRNKSQGMPLSALLKKAGYANIAQAYRVYTGRKTDLSTLEDLQHSVLPIENKTNQSRPRLPHIVISLQEGMSYHGLHLLAQQPDILGPIGKHLKEDFYFERVVSANDSTDETLDSLLFHSTLSPLSQSALQHTRILGNAILPFKQAGYRIVFAHGGNNGWRNLYRFLPEQGFDLLIGSSDILNLYPQASYDGAWGTYDEYLFQYVLDSLNRAEQPTLYIILTTSNHSPYRLPSHYQRRLIDLSLFDGVSFIYDEERTQNILQSFMYANDSLANFITAVKNSSKLRDNTLISFTGDHNFRNVFRYTDHRHTFLHRAVPLYFYIPEAYRKELNFRRYTPASHHDLFPTLYALTLKPALIQNKVTYLTLGRNLFQQQETNPAWGLFANSLLVTSEGIAVQNNQPQLFPWLGNGPYTGEPQPLGRFPLSSSYMQQANAYHVLLHWLLLESAKEPRFKQPPAKPARVAYQISNKDI